MDPSSRLPKTPQAAVDVTVAHTPAPGPVTDRDPDLTTAPAEAQAAPALVDPAALIGQSFGDFEVLAELGQGGMGVVYKARQISLDRLVALKVLFTGQATPPSWRQRFLAEARAVAALTHPNILAIYQTGDCPVGLYCAMEYIDGKTLDVLIQGRTVPIPFATTLLLRVAEAVHHAHTKGIIHRDLKPANIMIDSSRRPVVMDFGLAKLLDKPAGLTQEGDIVGTPAYMPPEQARGDLSQVGPHSDIYSLGAILYRLLAGQPPYVEKNPTQVVLKLLSPKAPPPPHDFRRDVPPALEQICLRCMQKDPARRYPSAAALVTELRRFRAGEAGQQRTSATMRAMTTLGSLMMTWNGRQVPLLSGSVLLLGRSPDCDLELPALTVSERHCRIVVDAQAIEAEDLGSAGGIQVNGKAVKRCRLQDGDQLDVGGFVLKVRLSKAKK